MKGRLSQHQVMQVALHDHILNTFHRLIQKVRVGSVGKVDIGVLVWVPDEISELVGEKGPSGFDVLVVAGIFWEVLSDRCCA